MAGDVRPLSNGTLTGTGTLNLEGYLFGGVDLNSDGTNAGVVIIRDGSSTGTILLDTSSVVGKTIIAPFRCPSQIVYYDISGIGADAMLYEWVE